MMTNLIRKATDKFDLDKSLSNNRVNKKVSICSNTTLNIKSKYVPNKTTSLLGNIHQ